METRETRGPSFPFASSGMVSPSQENVTPTILSPFVAKADATQIGAKIEERLLSIKEEDDPLMTHKFLQKSASVLPWLSIANW